MLSCIIKMIKEKKYLKNRHEPGETAHNFLLPVQIAIYGLTSTLFTSSLQSNRSTVVFKWLSIQKHFINHYVKACLAAIPRDISLGLLTYPYNAKGSLSTVCFMAINTTIVYLKTGIHFMSCMFHLSFSHFFFSYYMVKQFCWYFWRIIADQGFVFLIPGKHNMNEKKYRYSWICLKKMKIRMQIKEFL